MINYLKNFSNFPFIFFKIDFSNKIFSSQWKSKTDWKDFIECSVFKFLFWSFNVIQTLGL